jgi:hypothetical protein
LGSAILKELNKNQKSFFEEALSHFSTPKRVKLKEIREFAQGKGLIIPTTVLKNKCLSSERGYYDLTLCGIEKKQPKKLSSMNTFKSSDSLIVDMSNF